MTVRVVVLADTHIPRRARELPEAVIQELKTADAVVHLGDFTEIGLAQQLESFAPLYAVHGNNDSPEIRKRFPTRQDLSIAGHQITLIHGDRPGKTALQTARSIENVEVILFGHSHAQYEENDGWRLLFNPGSPTDRRRSPHRSFGILLIDRQIHAQILTLSLTR